MSRGYQIGRVTRAYALYRIRRFLHTPYKVAGAALMVLLAYFIIGPLVTMVQTSLTWQSEDLRFAPGATPGAFTLFHWSRVLVGRISSSMLWRPLVNTMYISLGVSVLALTAGGVLAWLVVRTDLPLKHLVSNLAMIPYGLPSWVIALAWIVVFKNRQIGGVTGLFEYITGASPPNWLSYGLVPITLCLSLHYYAFAFTLISGALTSVDAELEEAAEIVRATRFQILRKITFPIVLPAILSALILTFSRAVGTFGTPVFLGLPVRFYVLSTMLYANMENRFVSNAYILALLMILISAATVYANTTIIRARRSFVTLGGRGFRRRLVKLGRLKGIVTLLVAGFLAVGVLLPLGVLVWQTFMLIEGDFSPSNFTLHYWIGLANPRFAEGEAGILRNPMILGGAWNSVRLALTTALVTGVAGTLIGYVVAKGRHTVLGRAVEQLTFLPFLMPSIAFGAIYLTMFSRPHWIIPGLYGTFSILVLTCSIKSLPYSARSGISSMLQIGGELEEAAEVAGASWFTRFRRILVPLSKSGFLAGFLLTFITVMREMSLIVLLVSPSTRTLTTMTYRYNEQGLNQMGDAITVLLVTMILVCNFLIRRALRSREATS
ncbi:MAG: iron ABC transporter permease [Bacillota bacterium]